MKKKFMKTTLVAAMTATVMFGLSLSASAQSSGEIKVGVILGFTGPIESLTPSMAASAEMAFNEASDSGILLGGKRIKSIRADSTCVDAAAATAAAERLITSDRVVAIMGADCSGVTTAITSSVAVPNGVPIVSPSATSPALTSIKDKGFFFRTSPSDARQGEVLADVTKGRGIKRIAVTYTNNDYGKGLADSFATAFKKIGGKIMMFTAHEDGKADYSAEVAALAASGASELAVIGYLNQGGKGIIQTSLDTGAFERFVVADGMIGQSLVDDFGDDLIGTFGTAPGGVSEGANMFTNLFAENKIKGGSPYDGSSYDAGALIVLAMQAAGSAERSAIKSKMMTVANAPGEKIYPGEIAKALKILKEGGSIDYVGATSVEFNDIGEVYGTYRELEVQKHFATVRIHK
ncbi:MAG: ABC transporter substrate-binding protein [Proteobacteria bacterium]|nr:ABC transporter substrate-binding protein [Pseudomonadota bacterium]